jgi:hypothetical protein
MLIGVVREGDAMDTRRTFLKAGAAVGAAVASWPLPRALAAPDPARVALVVGNDGYPQSPLANAVNDAKAVAELLGQAGFNVALKTDATRTELVQAVEAFGRAIGRSEVKLGFFYYAGHGAQVEWRNYLLPVDAKVAAATDLPAQCLDLGVLLEHLGKARDKVFVVILDACRDNPFGAGFKLEQKGLSQFDAPVGSVLAFSTAPGSVAADGGGRNGLYSEHLVRELGVKGARIEEAFKRVRLNVRVASQGRQIPWESTSLESEVYLFPTAQKLTEAELERRFAEELARWNRIKGSKSAEDWVQYLRDFPQGKFSEIAQDRLNRVLAAVEPPRPQPVPVAVASGALLYDLKPGAPVPDFYGPANPNSAGTYPLGRKFTVGDEVTWRVVDPISRVQQRTDTFRVTKVDAQAERVELNDGAGITDLMSNVYRFRGAEFEPAALFFPAELQVGKHWATRYRRTDQRGAADWEMAFHITRRERVTVPAGEFEAFRVEGRGFNAQHRYEQAWLLWMVPGLNFVVKRDLIARAGGQVTFAEGLELISLKQHARG